ncbi:beta-ketoacyl-ACP synthase 3 [Kiritimatiella glycovorans]|uniref:Putative transketolase n=1 Tax=Kiritimatiella glycovorans TaxID=1307763 RepID=A0A0G3ENH6_9BACT|nr:beta-ketoacyl-ACP synthase 3 [Kiritimatiella glycovorans]AKJ65699.1 putative transketolase [Kiritimatiella glycovorans]
MDTSTLLELYRPIWTARRVDEMEQALAHRGEAFFFIPGSGHEAAAALAPHLTAADWLHCHYRDKALALARGVSVESMFAALLARDPSGSAGRRMPDFPCDPELNILSTPTLVGNNALQAAGVAAAVKDREGAPVVYCGLGDGATQEGEFFEAVAEAVRATLPVLFVVQDNRYALSTLTAGQTFYSTPDGNPETFYGLPIRRVEGADVAACHETFGAAVAEAREHRRPQIVCMRCERLQSHTNADDHTAYRTEEDLAEAAEHGDPLRNLERMLIDAGEEASRLRAIEEECEQAVQDALAAARAGAEPEAALSAKKPLPVELTDPKREYRGTGERKLTMIAALRAALRVRLEEEDAAYVWGEDLEDPKGDVFGLAKGLSSAFPGRVRNAPLSEATIVGAAVGQALAGRRPVACLQFADFLPPAFNQIASELGTMYWRTNGRLEAPVTVLSVCGGYRPGLGPFHAQTPSAVAAHLPGIDVFLPSTAADAAGLLLAALRSDRPSIFFYPKNLLNDRSVATSEDIDRHFVPIGKARIARAGGDLTLVAWGSTMPTALRTAEAVEQAGLSVEVVDLRTLSPWDREAVFESTSKTGRLLVIDEDHQTCGMAGEVCAAVAEAQGERVRVARLGAADAYVPYHFGNQLDVLPSFRPVLEKAAEMLDCSVRWNRRAEEEEGRVTVKTLGSSPSDETVKIVELHAAAGEAVEEGAPLASVEADKATMEIEAPLAGTVEKVLLSEGDEVDVGAPLLTLVPSVEAAARPQTTDDPGIPVVEKQRSVTEAAAPATQGHERESAPTVISSICSALGSQLKTNDELVEICPGWSPDDVVQRTGIRKRHWIGEGESALSLAVDACHKLFEREGVTVNDFDAIICSTGTPPSTTPSLACRILKELSPEEGETLIPAHDINAACSGYLYALQQACDMLEHDPGARILLVTSETLSPMLNKDDPGTFFLFGDAATASLVSREQRGGNLNLRVGRPVLSAMGAEEKVLYVPSLQSGTFMEMDGRSVFRIAVRKMIDMLDRACAQEGATVDDLSLIVPHQANGRIIEAIRKAIKFPTDKVFYYIRDYGNTSSNTIPLSLEALPSDLPPGGKIGLTAFGGGFTFAAGVVETLERPQ